ncbi:diguanylate cyclase [Cohnella sp. CFH 77786]|uniref:tetratricopeptide repeat-containing diguanylate cyclase n=1 Tax=Cohnella sp. CFH 77786 TaxID=2662265 RepID=UPI001C608F81
MTLIQMQCRGCHGKLVWHPDFGSIETCVYCFRLWGEEANLSREDNRVECYTPETFAMALDILEVTHRTTIESAITLALKAIEIASMLGVEELEMRAQLIHAEVMLRKGLLAEGGRILQKINGWALSHHPYILARSHRHLSTFFELLGDMPRTLEHALISIDHLPEDVLPRTRANHLMQLAFALANNGEIEKAKKCDQEILDIAAGINDIKLALKVLNNMAYTQYSLGDAEGATEFVERFRSLAKKYDVRLDPYFLDTIARVELLRGDYEGAERTLQVVIDRRLDDLLSEVTFLPVCFITAAQAQRLQGAYDRSQATLDAALRLCGEYGLTGIQVEIMQEKAELYAASGWYREAYEEFRSFHTESEKLRSKEREARAKVLQAVFETKEAKRAAEYYRNMALRDPLTNLYNRRYMDERVDELIRLSTASGEPFSLILLDLDHFKRINDTLSHEIGDTVLIHVAKILEAAAKEPKAAVRLGGEEFLVVLPDYDSKQALQFAEVLCHEIRSADWRPITGKLPVTASIGVSTFSEGLSRSRLLTLADNNLYQAKRAGRNRVAG